MVQVLVAAGADVATQDERGCTPLHEAADQWHEDTARALLAAGADVDAAGYLGWTPLRTAAKLWDDDDMVRFLLAAGAAVDHADHKGRTTLMDVVQSGCSAVLPVLLEAGASLEAVDHAGFTALTHAARHGSDTHVAALLAAGAAVGGSPDGPAPLAEAARRRHAAVIARLLAAGASCRPHKLGGMECALLRVWETVPDCLPALAQHLEPAVLGRVRAALGALRLRTPLTRPELYMRVVGLAFQR